MKAAVCREFKKPLAIEAVDLAGPQAGEVAVRIAACAICHSDVMAINGAWGGDLPAVFGHEATGVVEEVGAGVAYVAPGDHVVVTLVRSCGDCHFCAQAQAQLCETIVRRFAQATDRRSARGSGPRRLPSGSWSTPRRSS
jgi:S-(hydroxymethyl)glutathione dehydrogenase/alcohol dehydrogenase